MFRIMASLFNCSPGPVRCRACHPVAFLFRHMSVNTTFC
jgi:hypothetical protein